MNSPLLFLGGAGLPASIWDDVRALLPDGLETSVAAYPRSGSLDDYAAKVLAEAPERFVVVAHSIGGVVGTQLVAQAPDRVEGFVGVAASIPRRVSRSSARYRFRTGLSSAPSCASPAPARRPR